MKLVREILTYLRDRDDGTFKDVSLLNDDYHKIKKTVQELADRSLIVMEERKPRNFQFFGIPGNRQHRLMVKINSRGSEYLHHLEKEPKKAKKKKELWKSTYFFS